MSRPIVLVFGTRPEAIKLSPLYHALRQKGACVKTLFSGQHDILLPAMEQLMPPPDHQLKPLSMTAAERTNPLAYTEALTAAMLAVLQEMQPEVVVVQGDTSSALAGARAAHQLGCPVGHVEAGLRTHDMSQPWPEEQFRVEIDRLSHFHWAPSYRALENLQEEGFTDAVFTGNTIIDACQSFGLMPTLSDEIILTLHRRENIAALPGWFQQLDKWAAAHPEYQLVCPRHANPRVTAAYEACQHIEFIDPMPYPAFLARLSAARAIISDSGGIQEEALFFGKKILICREKTERPEVIEAGLGRLLTFFDKDLKWLLQSEGSPGYSAYGSGDAASRIARMLLAFVA